MVVQHICAQFQCEGPQHSTAMEVQIFYVHTQGRFLSQLASVIFCCKTDIKGNTLLKQKRLNTYNKVDVQTTKHCL